MPRDGRDPLGLGTAISMMMTERGLIAPAAGGSVLAQWETILTTAAPELTGHVQAVKFDANTGRLDVAPDAPAYGTKLRWIVPRLVATANEKVPGANVRSLHVLPPTAAPPKTSPTEAAATSPSSGDRTMPAGQVKTPRTLSAGYRRALEAHKAAQRTTARASANARPLRSGGSDTHSRAVARARAERAARAGEPAA
ncbi:DciA family protein [Streptomyces sp. NPDC057540]|uniref:DciA family protein n=1 Tax=Streptomyces sp. NPDC057540 TaxID=3346160 RepID=UPI0036C9CE60